MQCDEIGLDLKIREKKRRNGKAEKQSCCIVLFGLFRTKMPHFSENVEENRESVTLITFQM